MKATAAILTAKPKAAAPVEGAAAGAMSAVIHMVAAAVSSTAALRLVDMATVAGGAADRQVSPSVDAVADMQRECTNQAAVSRPIANVAEPRTAKVTSPNNTASAGPNGSVPFKWTTAGHRSRRNE